VCVQCKLTAEWQRNSQQEKVQGDIISRALKLIVNDWHQIWNRNKTEDEENSTVWKRISLISLLQKSSWKKCDSYWVINIV